jgi:hypothetical protein
MLSIHRLDQTDLGLIGDSLVVVVRSDDRFGPPEESVLIRMPADGLTLAALEPLSREMQAEFNWAGGYQEELTKTAGGIGADGLTELSMILNVAGLIGQVAPWLFKRLGRRPPALPSQDEADNTAVWALLVQYPNLARDHLRNVGEERQSNVWELDYVDNRSGDRYSVAVAGTRSGTCVTRVRRRAAD